MPTTTAATVDGAAGARVIFSTSFFPFSRALLCSHVPRTRLLRRTSVANQNLPPLYRTLRLGHASTMETQPLTFETQIASAAP
ncbi:hypothetical protein DEO72_LG6g1012 [Vigna unguiculata]|uniref:Uncharacterized protein n=1 Tax=Vigna unguiculata TaxID=3917 RepID=A0A4D6M6K6_VIGUN|nr:hypothetical protein DEO72_LG6g1012 [Vigna unguiculata]